MYTALRRRSYNNIMRAPPRLLPTHARLQGVRGAWPSMKCLFRKFISGKRFCSARPPMELREISLEKAGMVSLMEDGITKAAIGKTTVEEILRTLPWVHKNLASGRIATDTRSLGMFEIASFMIGSGSFWTNPAAICRF